MTKLANEILIGLLRRGPKRGTMPNELLTLATAIAAGVIFWWVRTHR